MCFPTSSLGAARCWLLAKISIFHSQGSWWDWQVTQASKTYRECISCAISNCAYIAAIESAFAKVSKGTTVTCIYMYIV